jgi:hypothetical protein
VKLLGGEEFGGIHPSDTPQDYTDGTYIPHL